MSSGSGKKILYFTAQWCGPCQAIKPTWYQLEKKHSYHITFTEVDVDLNRSLAEQHDVEKMPTFVFFSEGKEVRRFSGADVGKLTRYVEQLLKL
jgi:thioredoxin 1